MKAFESSDRDFVYNLIRDNGDNLFSNLPLITKENVFEHVLITNPGTWSVGFRNEKCFITLNNIDERKRSVYFGNLVGEGGLLVAKWALNYSFNVLNLNRAYSHTWTDNPKMDSLYKRLGAVHEGTEREHSFKNGTYVDMKIWAILKKEWDERIFSSSQAG